MFEGSTGKKALRICQQPCRKIRYQNGFCNQRLRGRIEVVTRIIKTCDRVYLIVEKELFKIHALLQETALHTYFKGKII